MESPALHDDASDGASSIVAESAPVEAANGLDELLLDELRDILHAEKQLTKALPKMAKAARSISCGNSSNFICPRRNCRSNVSMSVSAFSTRPHGQSPAVACKVLSRKD